VGSQALGCSTMCSLLFDWHGSCVIILACLLKSVWLRSLASLDAPVAPGKPNPVVHDLALCCCNLL